MKILKLSTLIPLVIAIAAVLVTQPAVAQVQNAIVFTEYSSTNLTATLTTPTGTIQGKVTQPFGDTWSVSFPVNSASLDLTFVSWAEPENPTLDPGSSHGWNDLSAFGGGASFTLFTLHSDTVPGAVTLEPNGGVFTNGNTSLQFIDLSDVPDTGSTFGLLALALAGLFGARRIRSLRAA